MNKFRSVLLALILVLGGLVSVPTVATADPVQQAASYICSYYRSSPSTLGAYCTVYSGPIRIWVRCSDGRTYYTPWFEPGTWNFFFDCYPATIASVWVQNVG